MPTNDINKIDASKELNAELWNQMNLNQLLSQALLLEQKLSAVRSVGNAAIEVQLMRGMTILNELITSKKGDDPGPTTIMR